MSAAATAERPRSARGALFGAGGVSEQQFGAPEHIVNKNAPRYFVQMGWNTLGVDTHAIPNSLLVRGEITPCRTVAQKANYYDIPETMRIPGSDLEGHDGKKAWASYWRHAWDEAERLIVEADKQERKNGLVEVKSLYSELGNEIYRRVNLNTLFFPTWPIMPDRHEEVLALLNERVEALGRENLNPSYVEVIFNVGVELIDATKLAARIQRDELVYAHQCMKLRPNEERYKPRYDARDYEMLRRTGMPEIDASEMKTATALERLTDSSLNGAGDLKEILLVMQKNAERQDKIIEMLLAERQAAKAEAGEAPAKPKAK